MSNKEGELKKIERPESKWLMGTNGTIVYSIRRESKGWYVEIRLEGSKQWNRYKYFSTYSQAGLFLSRVQNACKDFLPAQA